MEIRENLDRQELDAEERAIHTTELAACIKEGQNNYVHSVHNFGVQNSRGRPKKLASAVAQEVGTSRQQVDRRVATVAKLAACIKEGQNNCLTQLNNSELKKSRGQPPEPPRGGWSSGAFPPLPPKGFRHSSRGGAK